MKKLILICLTCLCILCISTQSHAEDLLDYMQNGGSVTEATTEEMFEEGTNLRQIMDEYAENGGISEESKNIKQIPMAKMLIGYVISCVVIIIFAFSFVQTILDLMYIGVPPMRELLYNTKENVKSVSGTSGAEVKQTESNENTMLTQASNVDVKANSKPKEKRFISDELKMLVNSYNQSSTTVKMPGVSPIQNVNKKNLITEYFKKRTVTMILIVICVICLIGSSVITDTGINIGLFILKLFGLA